MQEKGLLVDIIIYVVKKVVLNFHFDVIVQFGKPCHISLGRQGHVLKKKKEIRKEIHINRNEDKTYRLTNI